MKCSELKLKVINSRTAIAGAIIDLLLFFYFVVRICYDNMTSQPLQIYSLFIHSCNFIWVASVTSFFHFSLLLEQVFFVHFGHTWLTALSIITSWLWNWLFFTLIQRDTVKWVRVTLNEGYRREANRRSNDLYRFVMKYRTSQNLAKKFRCLVCFCSRLFETADLRSYCGIFLAIWQL